MQISTDSPIAKDILTPSGEISKDKTNLVSGAIMQSFAEMVWGSNSNNF